MIPVSAIDRVEILTDGASAIYGSDAVGGVVNFILRQDYQGIEAMAQAGTTTEGGGGQLLAGLTAGTRWNGGHAMLSYQFRDAQPVKASDRSFTINLPDNWDLFPDEKTNSLYGNAHQQLAPNLTLDASGSFAARNTRRSFLDGGLPVDAAARSRAYGGDVSLGLTLGSWEIEGSASAFETRSKQQQLQLGSLFNLYNSVNSYAELALKADGDLLDLGGGAAKLALGGSLRREHFESLFATSVNAPTAQDGSRLVASAYGELNLPFFGPGNARPGLEKLDFDVAGRLEHYEAIGSSFNPKIGLLWSPVAGLALRSSYGTSFRAPLLSESFGYYNVFLFPASLLYIDPSTAPAGVGAVLAGNNPAVKPETSMSLSLGAELQPRIIPGLRLNATYYAIRFSNRIALPSPQIVVIGDPAFAPIVSINPALAHVESLFDGANQLLDFSGPGFTNGGASAADVVAIVDGRVSNSAETRTSGLDLLLSYGFALGKNRFDFDLNANRIFKFDNKLTSASPWIHALNTPFNPLRFKVRGGLSWTRGSWSAFTFVNHAAPYRDDRGAVARPVAAFTTIDAGIGFDGGLAKTGALRHVKLALEVQNLLGTRPPRLLPQPGFNQDIGYDPVNATGLGRFVSLQLRTMW
jgi:outer membrane receptor protein involved in Fe transport